MKVSFHDVKNDAFMDTTDWLVPPRVGDSVFLIGDARYNKQTKEPRGFQFDAVVEEVLFFGPGHAIVTVRQKSKTLSESILDPEDEFVPPRENYASKGSYACPICGLTEPHSTTSLFKSIAEMKRQEVDADEPRYAHACVLAWKRLTKAYNKHALAANKVSIMLHDEDAGHEYKRAPICGEPFGAGSAVCTLTRGHASAAHRDLTADEDAAVIADEILKATAHTRAANAEKERAVMSWGNGGGSPGECAPLEKAAPAKHPLSINEIKEALLEAEGLINPGIVKTIKWLHANGFSTCDSGDGETHDFEIPYVHMTVRPDQLASESKRLFELLTAKGIKIVEFDTEASDGGPNIQASYDPASDIATLSLCNVKL